MLLRLLLPLRLALRHCYIIVSLSSCRTCGMFPRHISYVSSAYFVSYTILSYFVRIGIPFSSCILLQSTESGSLPHNHTHSPRLIASAPLLLVIAVVTSTPESDCQCSFCCYRLPQLPRVNANVSINRMHVTYVILTNQGALGDCGNYNVASAICLIE